jgi:hypothetical protein
MSKKDKELSAMTALSIKYTPSVHCEKCCLCGRAAAPDSGPRLCLADREASVCHCCGQKLAPSLAALVRLAQVANRVGRIGRHTVVPPMEALLDLAQAAESFSHSTETQRRAA